MDQNNLQQEEKDWYSKAMLENKAKVEATAKNKELHPNKKWKLRLEDKDFAEWTKEQKRHILFFDEAAKINPGKSGAGGVILDPKGNKIITYEWSLGELTNNRAEEYNLLLGTRLLNKNAIKDPIIIGDSTIIIVALDAKRDFKSIAINKIYQRIRTSFESLGNITLKHVLRNQNKDVDSHANKAIDRPVGIVKENNELYGESIP